MRRHLLRTGVPLALAVVVGLTLPTFILLIRAWGARIPQPAIEADYLLGLVWASLLGASILAWPVPSRDKPALLALWGAKCLVTLGFMLLYEANYSLDAYGYFLTAQQEFVPPQSTGVDRGTENFRMVMWLLGLVVPDSYHALKVTFAMAGLLGIYLVYRGAARIWGREDLRLLLLLGLYPSVLFWSSILGKDPLQLLGIGLYAYGVMSWRATGRGRYMIPAGVGILLAAFIRAWFGVILLTPLLIFGLYQVRGGWRRFGFAVASLALLFFAGRLFMDRMGIEGLAGLIERVDDLDRGWEGGSAQAVTVDITSFSSMVAFAPLGMFTALFRPLPGEVNNPFGLVAGLENLALLGLTLLAIVRASWEKLRDPVVQWAVVFLLAWSGAYGFVSFYNLGAAVRFKLQILPVFLCLLLYLVRRREPAHRPAPRPARPTYR